jgi:hypothetical protein
MNPLEALKEAFRTGGMQALVDDFHRRDPEDQLEVVQYIIDAYGGEDSDDELLHLRYDILNNIEDQMQKHLEKVNWKRYGF